MKKILFLILAIFIVSGSVFAASKTEMKWMKQGQELYAKKDFIKAAAAFEKALSENPENTNAMLYAGYSYMYAGEKNKAIAKLNAAYEKTGDEKIKNIIDKMTGNGGAAAKKENKLNGINEVSGGAARSAALGGAGIVLDDYSNQTDLFNSGFTSAYTHRNSKSVIHLVPSLNITGSKTVYDNAAETTVENSVTGFGAGTYGQESSLVALNLLENGYLILKPRLEMNPGSTVTSYPGTGAVSVTRNTGLTLFGGSAEIAYKITKNISAGLVFDYDSYGTSSVNKARETDKITADYSKIGFAGSASYIISAGDGDLSFALSGGTKSSLLSGAPFAIEGVDPGFDLEYAKLVSRYGLKTVNSVYIPPIIIFNIQITPPYRGVTTENTVTEGLNFALGVDYRINKVFEIDLAAEFVPAIIVKRTKDNVWTDLDTGEVVDNMLLNTWENNEYVNYDEGSSISAAIKARYHLGDMFVIGAACNFMNLGITRIPRADNTTTTGNPVTESLMILDASGGVTVKIGKMLNIPLEGFYQYGLRNEKEPVAETDDNWTTGVFGVKTGVEYLISEQLSARVGFDYASGGTSRKLVDSGTTTVDDPAGTDDNPNKSKIGIAAGAGYKAGAFDFNLSGRYVIDGESPAETGFISKSAAGIEILASVLIEL